jgi:hypothetical protein
MLNYTPHESHQSSHFFIQTPQSNICILEFKKLDSEIMFFDNDFLQENIFEMVVAKSGIINETYCKELAETVKSIFDNFLDTKDDGIVYVCVDENSLKHQLIRRFVNEDSNDHFNYFSFKAEGKVFAFFVNNLKSNLLKSYISLSEYFEKEYNIEFEPEL